MGSRRSLPGVDRVCFSSGFIMAQSSVFDSCAENRSGLGPRVEVRAQGMNTLKRGHHAGASRTCHGPTKSGHTTGVLCCDGGEGRFGSITRSAKLYSTTRAVSVVAVTRAGKGCRSPEQSAPQKAISYPFTIHFVTGKKRSNLSLPRGRIQTARLPRCSIALAARRSAG